MTNLNRTHSTHIDFFLALTIVLSKESPTIQSDVIVAPRIIRSLIQHGKEKTFNFSNGKKARRKNCTHRRTNIQIIGHAMTIP